MDKKIINWVIAIIVAIVYLLVSIIFVAWAYSWIIWVVYAIYRFIVKCNNLCLESENMVKSNIKKEFNCGIEKLWNVITDNTNYNWRSDLK